MKLYFAKLLINAVNMHVCIHKNIRTTEYRYCIKLTGGDQVLPHVVSTLWGGKGSTGVEQAVYACSKF